MSEKCQRQKDRYEMKIRNDAHGSTASHPRSQTRGRDPTASQASSLSAAGSRIPRPMVDAAWVLPWWPQRASPPPGALLTASEPGSAAAGVVAGVTTARASARASRTTRATEGCGAVPTPPFQPPFSFAASKKAALWQQGNIHTSSFYRRR